MDHSWKKRARFVGSKAQFRTELLRGPLSGKWVKTPKVSRRKYRKSEALQKERKEAGILAELWLQRGYAER